MINRDRERIEKKGFKLLAMAYFNTPKIHGVISSPLYNKITTNSSFKDVTMPPKLLEIPIKYEYCKVIGPLMTFEDELKY